MADDTVVGVDSSTQSVKVELRRVEDGRLLWSGSRPHPPVNPPRAEQDPVEWWAALEPLLDEAATIARASSGRGPSGLSVAAQQHGMVVLGQDGRPLRPAKLWNDTESAPDAAALVEAGGGPAEWAARTGSVLRSAFTLTKLAWLRRVEPALHAAAARVLLPHDRLALQVSGQAVTDRGDASGTGYWSPTDDAWWPAALEMVGLPGAVLPRVLGPFEPAGTSLAGGRGPTGSGPGPDVLVGPGTGDNMAAALGLGLRPGDVAVSLGTSGTVFTVSSSPSADPSGAVAGFADASGPFLPLVCTSNAARVLDTTASWLGVDHAELDRLACSPAPGSGGVVMLPYLDGERTPDLPAATGTLVGLRTSTTRDQLARAAVEGVVCSVLEGLDALGRATPDAALATEGLAGRLFLLGGASRSESVAQVLADLSGRPVIRPAHDELVAAGACVQAAAVVEVDAGSSGADPAGEVAHRWPLDRGPVVEPTTAGTEAAERVRSAYRRARLERHPETAGATAGP